MAVPMYCLSNGDILNETSFSEANFLLYDILNGVNLNGIVHIHIRGRAVPVLAYYLPDHDFTVLYIHNSLPLKHMPKSVLLRLSRLQYGPDLFPYGLIDDVDVLRHAFFITRSSIKQYKGSLENYPIIHSWMTGTSEPPITKISSLHLRHLTIKELRKLGISWFDHRARFMYPCLEHLASLGMHESMFIGFIIWAKSLPDIAWQYISCSGIWQWKFDSLDDFIKKIKSKFTLRLKALQNLVPLDLKPFFEMEVLANRGLGSVDWHSEKENRTRPNLATFDAEAIFQEAGSLFTRIKNLGGQVDNLKWSSYINKRWQWAPTGAYHSQYEEDLKYVAKDSLNRHKFFSLNAMPKPKLDDLLSRPPEIRAWPSVKCEWTKMRAIYGVDATNFILTGFVFGDCERVLSQLFPIGPGAEESNVKNTVREIMRNGVPYCFDFEDFNSQHSVASMREVLKAYFSVFGKRMSVEQRKVFPWILHSLDSCFIKEQGQDSFYKTTGTLLSGWRLTTFMNTVLNYIYIRLLTKGRDLVATHNGDDVLAAVDSLQQVQALVAGAELHNVRFQMSKCFLGSIAEFLRVDHYDGGGGQYLSRAIATLVHGPTEMAVPNKVLPLQQAIVTRIAEAQQRGMLNDVAADIKKVQYEYLCYKWNISLEDLDIIERTHVSMGGLSLDITTESLQHEIKQKEYSRRDISDKQKQDLDTPMPGAWDYATQVCKVVVDAVYKHKIYKKAVEAIHSLSISRTFGVEITKVKPDVLNRLKASLYGLYRSDIPHTKLMMAKAFGIPIHAIGETNFKLLDILKHEVDVIRALEILL